MPLSTSSKKGTHKNVGIEDIALPGKQPQRYKASHIRPRHSLNAANFQFTMDTPKDSLPSSKSVYNIGREGWLLPKFGDLWPLIPLAKFCFIQALNCHNHASDILQKVHKAGMSYCKNNNPLFAMSWTTMVHIHVLCSLKGCMKCEMVVQYPAQSSSPLNRHHQSTCKCKVVCMSVYGQTGILVTTALKS